MKWLDYILPYLWPFKRRERIEAEKQTERLFKAQLQEALLRQDNLREAVAQMKKIREDQVAESQSFRHSLESRPT